MQGGVGAVSGAGAGVSKPAHGGEASTTVAGKAASDREREAWVCRLRQQQDWLKAAEARASMLQQKLFAAGLKVQELEAAAAKAAEERDAEATARREVEAASRELARAKEGEVEAARQEADRWGERVGVLEGRLEGEVRERVRGEGVVARLQRELQEQLDRKETEREMWERELRRERERGERREVEREVERKRESSARGMHHGENAEGGWKEVAEALRDRLEKGEYALATRGEEVEELKGRVEELVRAKKYDSELETLAFRLGAQVEEMEKVARDREKALDGERELRRQAEEELLACQKALGELADKAAQDRERQRLQKATHDQGMIRADTLQVELEQCRRQLAQTERVLDYTVAKSRASQEQVEKEQQARRQQELSAADALLQLHQRQADRALHVLETRRHRDKLGRAICSWGGLAIAKKRLQCVCGFVVERAKARRTSSALQSWICVTIETIRQQQQRQASLRILARSDTLQSRLAGYLQGHRASCHLRECLRAWGWVW